MCGVIFTVIGGFLAYTLFWVITDRIADYRLDRDGTPVGVIFIILLATTFCLAGGLSSLFGSKWFIRLLLLVGLWSGSRKLEIKRQAVITACNGEADNITKLRIEQVGKGGLPPLALPISSPTVAVRVRLAGQATLPDLFDLSVRV